MEVKVTIQDEIQEAVKQIVDRFSPHKVILFGSHATGTATPDSDLDLLVIMDSPPPSWEFYAGLSGALEALNVPFDVLTITPEEFEETRQVIGGLAYAPAKYGRVVYEKP